VSAESEFHATGWPPLGCLRIAAYTLILTPALVLAASGVNAGMTLPGGWVRVPMLVPWLLGLAAVYGRYVASYRSRRYVIDSERVRVLGGVFREKLLADLPRERVSEIELLRDDPAIRHETGALLLEGAGLAAFEELKRAWPSIPAAAVDGASSTRRGGRRAILLAVVFLLLVVLAEVDGWYRRECDVAYATTKVAVAVAVMNARATVARALGEPGEESFGAGTADLLVIFVSKDAEWRLSTSGPRDSLRLNVVTSLHYRWVVCFATMTVEIHPTGAPEDERFVKELTKELDQAHVVYTIVRHP
jgi:hypothetical protein